MNTRRIACLALATLLATGAASSIAYAQDRDRDQGQDQDQRDITTRAGMKVTLQQAIGTAEQQMGGRAVGAEVFRRKGAAHISVEVAGPGGIKTVLVDAQTGKVTATNASSEDREDND
jgi:uncharacterized membrane protein YkoI